MSIEHGSALKWQFADYDAPAETKWEEHVPETDVALDDALESVRNIVTEDFDDEEPSLLATAFDRAQLFLESQSRQMKKKMGFFPPAPRISPGPKGSADLRWDLPSGGLLVNIPADNALATYYGELEGGTNTKGSFNPNSWDLVIFTWLNKN